jgi:hypothetical protein
MAEVTAKVQAIVAAAEQAAAGMRAETERRANERIAEADRAAQNRVDAAEAEAKDILAAANAEAERLRRAGREEARTTVLEAGEAARQVLERGTELSREIEQLGTSLKRNASVILHDVRHAHDELTRTITEATPAPEGGGDVGEVPEFVQRSGRTQSAPAPAPRVPRAPREDRAPVDAGDVPADEIEIPEFSRDYVPQRHRRRR